MEDLSLSLENVSKQLAELPPAREVWVCQECGKKFRTVKAAERASLHGCPKCGGVDVDLVVLP